MIFYKEIYFQVEANTIIYGVITHFYRLFKKGRKSFRGKGDVLKMHLGTIEGKSDKILDLVISKSKTLHT